MKLYHTPGGTWTGTEANYNKAMKAEGLDPKTATRKTIEVPTSKAELMEFLSFYNVRCIEPLVPVADSPPAAAPPAAPQADTTVPEADGPQTNARPARAGEDEGLPAPPAAQGNFQEQVDNLPVSYAAFIASRIVARIAAHLHPVS